MSSISLTSLMKDIRRYGFEDPEILEVMNFKDIQDLLEAMYPGRPVTLAADAEQYLGCLLSGAAAKASLARRLECRGVSPGLSDALWAAQETRRRAQAALAGSSGSAPGPAGTLRVAGTGCEWRPLKRVRRAAGLGEADRLLMKKWGSRLAVL